MDDQTEDDSAFFLREFLGLARLRQLLDAFAFYSLLDLLGCFFSFSPLSYSAFLDVRTSNLPVA